MKNWKTIADDLYNELQREKYKNEQLVNALNSIGIIGHIDIKGQHEKAYSECLKIASDTLGKLGYFDEE